MSKDERRDEGILRKIGDTARKKGQAAESGNKADEKAAWAAHDDMMQAAREAGLLDDD